MVEKSKPTSRKMKIRLNVGRTVKVFGIIVISCIIVSQLLSFYLYKSRTVKKDEDYFDHEAFAYFEGDDGGDVQHQAQQNKAMNNANRHLKGPSSSKAFSKSIKVRVDGHSAFKPASGGATNTTKSRSTTTTATAKRTHRPEHLIPETTDPCGNITYTTFQTESFCLKEDTKEYSKDGFRAPCFLEGTKFIPETQYCICNPGWFGQSCSVPTVVKESNYPTEYGVQLSKVPRRIIYGFPFSHEFDMLEARVNELGDFVDLYLIVESNYSAFGQPKERMLYKNLQKGYLKSFQHKMFYLFLDYFPEKGQEDGWVIDGLLRDFLAVGMSKIRNLRDDDIFLLTDADEIPTRESLVYLKMHFGYPQPIGFNLRHTYFGFFWASPHETSHAYGACRIDMLREVFDWRPYLVRSATTNMNGQQLEHFKHHHNGRISPWNFGTSERPAGWHCSWCFNPEGIKYKMLAAHISDRPRWGNFPDKIQLPYIQSVVANGTWFDGKMTFTASHRLTPLYAPQFMKDNSDRFSHLLELPDYAENKPV